MAQRSIHPMMNGVNPNLVPQTLRQLKNATSAQVERILSDPWVTQRFCVYRRNTVLDESWAIEEVTPGQLPTIEVQAVRSRKKRKIHVELPRMPTTCLSDSWVVSQESDEEHQSSTAKSINQTAHDEAVVQRQPSPGWSDYPSSNDSDKEEGEVGDRRVGDGEKEQDNCDGQGADHGDNPQVRLPHSIGEGTNRYQSAISSTSTEPDIPHPHGVRGYKWLRERDPHISLATVNQIVLYSFAIGEYSSRQQLMQIMEHRGHLISQLTMISSPSVVEIHADSALSAVCGRLQRIEQLEMMQAWHSIERRYVLFRLINDVARYTMLHNQQGKSTKRRRGESVATTIKTQIFNHLYPQFAQKEVGETAMATTQDFNRDRNRAWTRLKHWIEFGRCWKRVVDRFGPGILALLLAVMPNSWIEKEITPISRLDLLLDFIEHFRLEVRSLSKALTDTIFKQLEQRFQGGTKEGDDQPYEELISKLAESSQQTAIVAANGNPADGNGRQLEGFGLTEGEMEDLLSSSLDI